MSELKDPKIVVIGGGTGSFVVLRGLKKYAHNITALVSMADDGGSTGVLRDELGVLPPGDVRQCLVALSNAPRLRELFNYRFEDGAMSGHSFGNLFLTALEKNTGSFAEAVDEASRILDIGNNRVIPITLDQVTLVVDDGEREIWHEREIREATFAHARPKLRLEPEPTANPAALRAIAEADLIVLAPGGLYESLGASLSIRGIGAALAQSRAERVYICNLMNQNKHTPGFSVIDYADEVERLAGREFLDEVIYNTNTPSSALLDCYALEDEHPTLLPDKTAERHYALRGTDLLARQAWVNTSLNDPLSAQRALIRHNSKRLAQCILGSFENNDGPVREVKSLYVIDMDRTLIQTSRMFDALCTAANNFQDHLGDELARDYRDYLTARDTKFNQLDFDSENVYIKMRLAGKNATFSPTIALNRILGKRHSTVEAKDVYDAFVDQLSQNIYREYLLPGAEEFLREINQNSDAEAMILTYGEQAFQDAKYAAVVEPLLRSLDMKPIYWSTPDRRKANFFKDHLTSDGAYEFLGMYGVENLRAQETICVGDERDDIIECESLPNYRAYCVRSKVDFSDRAWPTEQELKDNHCQLFRSLEEVIAAEQKIQSR